MELTGYLKTMVDRDGSDLFLSTGAPIGCKIYGKLVPLSERALEPGETLAIAQSLMSDEQCQEFESRPEMNLAISHSGVGRFRVNIFKQRNEVSLVIRAINTDVPTVESLKLPEVLPKLVMQKRGLLLFVGATGSGKSTSLAALIDYRNRNSAGHIITIEDPVEFVHKHKRCIVNQREVGVDTLNYEDALKNTLRQAPDVILIGEIRSEDTMEHALAFAETGHLCLSTLHANNANQALDRIINFFPEERHKQVLQDLSLNLRGIISQRLIPTVDGKRAAAIEILMGTPLVCEMIKRGQVGQLKEVMEKSESLGMQTFDSALLKLYRQGKISLDEALKNADSKNNLRLKITLAEQDDSPAPRASSKADANQSNNEPSSEEQESASAMRSSGGLTLELTPKEEEEKEDDDEKKDEGNPLPPT